MVSESICNFVLRNSSLPDKWQTYLIVRKNMPDFSHKQSFLSRWSVCETNKYAMCSSSLFCVVELSVSLWLIAILCRSKICLIIVFLWTFYKRRIKMFTFCIIFTESLLIRSMYDLAIVHVNTCTLYQCTFGNSWLRYIVWLYVCVKFCPNWCSHTVVII